MKLTKNIISREDAIAISPEYVAFAEGGFDFSDPVLERFEKLRKGDKVITYMDGQFVRAKVTTIDRNSYQAIDGPVVRVSNGEYSWRVDGSGYAFPITK